MSTKRRTILFADLVGSTKLSMKLDSDEDYELKTTLREQFEQKLSKYDGEFRKALGDAFIITFDDVTNAVNYSIDVQQSVQQLEFGNLSVAFRMGLHTGTVTVDEDGEIHGDDLKIAEWVEGRCRPNEIYLTSSTYKELDSEKFELVELGQRSIKGTDGQITLFRVSYEKKISGSMFFSLDEISLLLSSPKFISFIGLVIVLLGTIGYFSMKSTQQSSVEPFQQAVSNEVNTKPGRNDRLLITRLYNDGTAELFEIVNPTSDTQFLILVKESSGFDFHYSIGDDISWKYHPDKHSANKHAPYIDMSMPLKIPPCENFLNISEIKDFSRRDAHAIQNTSFGSKEGFQVVSWTHGDTQFKRDSVGWSPSLEKADLRSEFFEGEPVLISQKNQYYLQRKHDDGLIDTNNNRQDFVVDTGPPYTVSQFVEQMGSNTV